MFNPVEKLIEMIKSMVDELTDTAFGWISIFMLEPTDFSRYERIDEIHWWIFVVSVTLGGLFLVFQLVKLLVQQIGGYSRRSVQEVTVKGILGTLLAVAAPWLMQYVLLGINNEWVKFVVNRGVDSDRIENFLAWPKNATITLALVLLGLVIIFLVLSIQYIIRLADLSILLIFSPIAAMSIVNEDMDIFPVWWREAISTVFQQSFQITVLWLIFNEIAGGEGLDGYIIACGLMVAVLRGPGFLRRFLYSTGIGKSMVGAAGSAGKMALYKMAMRRVTG